MTSSRRIFARSAVVAVVACLAGPVGGAVAQEVTILTGPSGPTTERAPEFTFESASTTLECRHRHPDDFSITFSPCTSPYRPDLPLPDGDWVFEVQVMGDPPPASARRDFTVDTLAPGIATIGSGPPALSNDPTPEFAFTADGADGFKCWLHPLGDTTPAFAACSSTYAPGALGDGAYVLEVHGVDAAGNSGPPATSSFQIDTTPPETAITGAPNDTTAATAVFLFDAPGAARFSCRLDGGSWQPCGSPHTYPTLSLGPHTFEVTAVDEAGNEDPTPARHAWQVLRPGRVIPGAVEQATALARELVQMRRALARVPLRRLARRRTVTLRTFDALTAGRVGVRARTRVRTARGRRWIGVISGRREVPDAGRHLIRARVTRRARALARRRRTLPLELRLSFTDLAGRSLSATSKLTLRR